MSVALALAWGDKRLLLGEGAPKALEADFRSMCGTTPSHVDRVRTMFVGPKASSSPPT